MSLFGKMMAILNVLAAGAFLFLAAQDYAVRQQWAYAVFKHRLALTGLPVDEDETDADNRPIVLDIDDELAKSISGDSAVKTMEQFLELRKSELDPVLEKRGAEAYVKVLLPLVRTEQERLQLLKGQVPLAELKKQYEALFDNVSKANDREAKRQAIARLLVAWSDVLPDAKEEARRKAEYGKDPKDRQHPTKDAQIERLAKILGPKQITRELTDQAARIERWAFEVEDARNRERTHFAYRHTDLVNTLIPWHGTLADQVKFLAWKKKQADEQVDLAQKQIMEVDKLTKQLAASKEETARLMDRLTKQQDELHGIRVKLRDADVINQMKEMLIRKLEGLR